MSATVIDLNAARQKGAPTKAGRFTEAEKRRAQQLLLDGIARNLGVKAQMDAKFGATTPEPGDAELMARVERIYP